MKRRIKVGFESYEDLPPRPIAEVGTSPLHKTSWHILGRPEIDVERCTGCRICWVFCPEGAIKLEKGIVAVDYDYCKGCGICANECPLGAITMVRR